MKHYDNTNLKFIILDTRLLTNYAGRLLRANNQVATVGQR
jgi:hypothetical protein